MRNLHSKIIISLLFFSNLCTAQTLQTTTEFLGYELGSRFTFHHQVVDYFQHVADNSDKVAFYEYGKTAEGRSLIVTYISSPENIANLKNIQKANLNAVAGKETAKANQKAIVWLSYNIHGDEAAATEAALATLEELVSDDKKITNWLNDVIVIIDPCENPDGKDRYTMWINQVMNAASNPDIDALEHHQPWPGGRFSHYLFDLNRDWAWQTQVESQQRVKLYQEWQPHVHVDFHEMGHHQSYFFAPAAEPMHESITDWQREFQVHVGKNHAQYFDDKGWLYYTKEVFDLLYPSYGDTWPIFNGAIGFTYEQGGSGRAGISVTQETGQVLTLAQRLKQHKTTGLSTIETAYNFRTKLLNEFNDYFAEARENPKGEFKTYVVQTKNQGEMIAFLDLLEKQKIEYDFPKKSGITYNGFDYFTKKNTNFTLRDNDIILSAHQTQSNLLKVLFEPETKLQDSLTYDLTAWALPYAYGLQTYGLKEKIETYEEEAGEGEGVEEPAEFYAYVVDWKNVEHINFLSEAIQQDLKVRFLNKQTIIEGKEFDRGSLIITKADNPDNFEKRIHQVTLDVNSKGFYTFWGTKIQTGMVDLGSDLGANSVQYIKPPRVALLSGSGVSPTAFGEVWHYFEQTIDYPISILHTEYFRQVDLDNYDVLILTNGRYSNLQATGKLLSFVRNGGKIICLGTANQVFANERDTQLGKAIVSARNQEEFGENPTGLKRYENRERANLSNSVAGSIYKVHLDNSHPLAYGYDTTTYIIKQNRAVYPLLSGNAWNVGMFKADSHISGFVGANLKPKIPQTMAFGVEKLGKGRIVYLCDSPIFRGFWYSGNTLLANAVFFVD